MKCKKIITAIRRVCFKHLFFPVILMTITLFLYFLVPFDDIFAPKYASGSAEAMSIYQMGNDFCEVHVDKLYYSGFDVMYDGETEASYYYDITDNRCTFYLLKANMVEDKPMEIEDITLRVKMTKKDGLYDNMASIYATNLGWTVDGMNESSNPIIMNQYEFHFYRYLILYIVLVMLIIYSSVSITLNILFLLIPYAHPALLYIYASSSKGMGDALEELNESFENNILFSAGDMFITDKFFINLGKNEVSMIRLDRIVIGYEHGKLKNILGWHMKMTVTLYLIGYYRRKIVASGKESADVIDVVEYIREKYPDIIWGHTKANTKQASKIIREHKKNKGNKEKEPTD